MSSRRAWTEEQDKTIKELVNRHGQKNWANIAEELSLQFGNSPRSGKQCRQRWHNHLNPNIQKKVWSKSEEELMFKLHKEHGNKWTVIADALPGRTDNSIKNYFYSTIRRSLRRIGKFVGTKNSTKQMKIIKPSTLSKIFQASSESALEQAVHPKELEMLTLIKENCETVRDSIIKFTNYKPKRNDKANQLERIRLEDVINKMVSINEIYEKIKMEEKRGKLDEIAFHKDSGKLLMSDDGFDEESDSEEAVHPTSIDKDRQLYEQRHSKVEKTIVSQPELEKKREKIDPRTPTTDIKSVQNTLYTIPTVIIKPYQYPFQTQNNENNNIGQLPDFFVELKEDSPELLIQKRSSFSFQSPGVFSKTPSNNPFNFFHSPSTPRSFDEPIGVLSSMQNSSLDDFKNMIQKQIEGNLNGEGKTSGSSKIIGGSPGSAFSYVNSH